MTMEVPEHLRQGPLAEQAAKALEDAAAAASASNSVPRISLRGREFRLIEGGEEVAKFRDQLFVTILGVEPEAGRMIKTYYAKGYQSGAKEPPTCSSEDGIAPAVWVTDRQSSHCQTCPKNVFGSAKSPTGKPTKACRDSKRIWLKLAEGNKAGDKPYELAEFNERTLYGLNVTVASLKAFSEYGRTLAGLGQGPAVCVTKITMLDMEFPQLEFAIHAWLDAPTATKSLQYSADRPWKIQYRNAGLALSQGEPAAPTVALPTSAAPPVPSHLAQPTGTVAPTAQPPSSQVIDDQIQNW